MGKRYGTNLGHEVLGWEEVEGSQRQVAVDKLPESRRERYIHIRI
jgi:hypothetical protein